MCTLFQSVNFMCALFAFDFIVVFVVWMPNEKLKCIWWKMKSISVLNWFDFRRHGSHRLFEAPTFFSHSYVEQTSFFLLWPIFTHAHIEENLFKIKHSCLFGCFCLCAVPFSFSRMLLLSLSSNKNVIEPLFFVFLLFIIIFFLSLVCHQWWLEPETTSMEALMSCLGLCVPEQLICINSFFDFFHFSIFQNISNGGTFVPITGFLSLRFPRTTSVRLHVMWIGRNGKTKRNVFGKKFVYFYVQTIVIFNWSRYNVCMFYFSRLNVIKSPLQVRFKTTGLFFHGSFVLFCSCLFRMDKQTRYISCIAKKWIHRWEWKRHIWFRQWTNAQIHHVIMSMRTDFFYQFIINSFSTTVYAVCNKGVLRPACSCNSIEVGNDRWKKRCNRHEQTETMSLQNIACGFWFFCCLINSILFAVFPWECAVRNHHNNQMKWDRLTREERDTERTREIVIEALMFPSIWEKNE